MNIFIFLVVLILSLIINWSKYVNERVQNILVFIVISVAFYLIKPICLLFIFIILISNYYFNFYLDKVLIKRFFFYFSLFINVLFLLLLKFYFFDQTFYSFKEVYLLIIFLLPIRCIFYMIGLNRNRISFEKDFFTFLDYIVFFPLYFLDNLKKWGLFHNQLRSKRDFNRSIIVDGFRQILWGSFKILVIATNSEIYANQIFNSYESRSSLDLILGVIFYIFQVYGYSSGYFDLCLGLAKQFGLIFKKSSNHSIILYPIYYLKELYLFVEQKLKGFSSNCLIIIYFFALFYFGLFFSKSIFNILLFSLFNTIIVSLLNVIKIFNPNFNLLKLGLNILIVFVNCILIRSLSFSSFNYILVKIFSLDISSIPNLNKSALATIILILLFCIIEYIGRKNSYALERILLKYSVWFRWSFYSFIIMLIALFN